MSSPREAVYDVLLSQRQRAAEAAAKAADEQARWEQYERDNRTADDAYRRKP